MLVVVQDGLAAKVPAEVGSRPPVPAPVLVPPRSMVIDVSKKHFPQMAAGYTDPRVKVLVWGCALLLVRNSCGSSSSCLLVWAGGRPASRRCTAASHCCRAILACPPRVVQVHVCDGIKFVQDAAEGTYDLIVVDSSDPVGPAEVLFQKVRILRW